MEQHFLRITGVFLASSGPAVHTIRFPVGEAEGETARRDALDTALAQLRRGTETDVQGHPKHLRLVSFPLVEWLPD